MAEKKPKAVVVGIRMPVEDRAELVRIAERDTRRTGYNVSLNAVCLRAINEFLDREKGRPNGR